MAGNTPFDLEALALGIVRSPGFSIDGQGLEAAFRQWDAELDAHLRSVAYKLFAVRYIREVAEQDRTRTRSIPPPAAPPVSRSEPVISTESDGYRNGKVADTVPPPPQEIPPAGPALPAAEDRPALPDPAPPVFLPPAPPAPSAPERREPAAKPVQQESRKVAGYQKMYPDLAVPVAIGVNYHKPRGDCTASDNMARHDKDLADIRSREAANAGENGRIADRLRLVAKGRIAVAQREQEIAALRADAEWSLRIADAQRAHGNCLVKELPPEVLDELGFKRVAA